MYVLFLRTRRVVVKPQSSQNPLLPVTVQDQIRLWELEKNRLKSQEGGSLLLHGFLLLMVGI
jgi:hypothetical protein